MSHSPSKHAALFTTNFVPYSQTFIYDEVRSHRDYKVTVLAQNRMNEDQFPYEPVIYPTSSLETFIYKNTTYSPTIHRAFREHSFDLIHSHFGFGSVYSVGYAQKYDLPYIVTFWGNDVSALVGKQRYQPDRWRYLKKYPEILERADLILGVSEEMCQYLNELGADADKIRLYHQGVDFNKFESAPVPPTDTTNFLLIGRFTEKKGHRYAVKALAELIEAGHKVHLSFAGKGELEPEIRALVNKLDVQDYVTFTGMVPHAEMQDMVKKAHVVLVPSVKAHDHDMEGSPTVLREAQAVGRPVIGTYHAGIPEIIAEGETGLLVPERTVRPLRNAMRHFIDNPEDIEKMGTAGRIRMENQFKLEDQVAYLEQLYDEAIARHAKH
jgi:colanic acid/amylovoran biosynthesis glycosyltransferase